MFSSPANSNGNSKEDVNEKSGAAAEGSDVNLNDRSGAEKIDEKALEEIVNRKQASSKRQPKERSCKLGLGYFVSSKPDASKQKAQEASTDLEGSAGTPTKRPMKLLAPIYCGITVALSFCEFSFSSLRRAGVRESSGFSVSWVTMEI